MCSYVKDLKYLSYLLTATKQVSTVVYMQPVLPSYTEKGFY